MGTTEPIGAEFRRVVRVDQLGHDEQRFVWAATEPERRALAARFGVQVLATLEAVALVHRIGGGGARARVDFSADVVQLCVVTLEPVPARIADAFELDFLPSDDPQAAGAREFEAQAADPPGAVVDGEFDVGAVIAEYVSLAIDPYPRKPGVEFGGIDPAGGRRGVKDAGSLNDRGPFAALKDWKGKA